MTKTILLADDSVTIQKVVELTFMDEDFRVSAVSNGAEAIARLSESMPDIVIADVHMPGAGGFEVCRRSKELYPAVPVLLLVGTFEGFDSDEAIRCGADGHLKKPFDSQDLMRRVRELAAAPSRSVPVPPAPAEVATDEAARAFSDSPAPADEPSGASVTPVEDQWEPVAEDFPSLDSPASAVEEPALYEEPLPTFSSTPVYEPSAVSGPDSTPSRVAEAAPPAPASAGPALSDADVDRIARRMIELVGDKPVRDVAWEVVPDLAEVILRSRIRELESSID